jgi:hypothetical protein
MSKVLQNFTSGLRRPQTLPIIKAVTFYENRAVALRAKNVLDRVASAFCDEFVFSNEVWSFDTLRFASLRQDAMHEVGDADLVVISIRNDVQVPREILYGLGTWHRREDGNPPAAIILWDRQGKPVSEVVREQASFKAVAHQKGIDLLLEGSEAGGDNIDGVIGRKFRYRTSFPAHEMMDLADHPALDMHWGINE